MSMNQRAFLCADPAGILRGECRGCKSCPAFGLEKVQRLSLDAGDGAAPRMSTAEKQQALDTPCQGCGCPAHRHWGLDDWWRSTRKRTQTFQDSDGMYAPLVADSLSLPAAAQFWEPEAAALFLVSQGQFDPRRDGRKDEASATGRRDAMVSVICTSTEKNHPSHPLLYECFQRQTYAPRELIVVDTGTQPSTFMQEKAKADPRVVYRFFFREEHGLEQEEDSLEHVMNEDRPEEVLQFVTWTPDFADKFDANRAEVPCQGLTLGMKRNIAVHLSQGSMLMHFNIGDLYSRDYLACMRGELLTLAFQPNGGALAPAAATLGDWHALDLTTQAFRQLDLQERGHHLPEEMKRSLQRARGFTYAYTRKAWDVAAFLNVDHPEGQLVKVLQRNRVPFKVVHPPIAANGLAARGYDKAHITGGSVAASMNNAIEIRDLVDCSACCGSPAAFRELMPVVESVSGAIRKIRDGRINELLDANGTAFFCIHCDAALAFKQYLKEVKAHGDGAGGSVEIAQFSRAGGAVAEGQDHPEATGQPTPVGRIARSRLTCASPGCTHRVHTDLEMGGYCCIACYQSRGWHHGPRCERSSAPTQNHGADACSLPRDGGPPPPPIDEEFEKACLPEPAPQLPVSRAPLLLPKAQPRPLPQQLLGMDTFINRFQPLKSPDVAKGPRLSVISNLRPMMHIGGPSMVPVQRGGCVQRPAPVKAKPARDPEPVQIKWFPGWSWRNALCRHCGKAVGWRYEKSGGSIFWAFEQRHLVERLPPAPHAVPVSIPVKQESPVEAAKKRQAAAKAAAAEAAAAEAAAARAAAAEAAAAEARAAAAQAVPVVAEEGPAAAARVAREEDPASLQAGRRAIACLSRELRSQLAGALEKAPEKFCVDQALGALKLDEETRETLQKELEIDPGMAAVQADIWIAKCFRGKVYALRKLDFKVLRRVLEEGLAEAPAEAKAAEEPPGAAAVQAPAASSPCASEGERPEKAKQSPAAAAGAPKPAKVEPAPSAAAAAASSSDEARAESSSASASTREPAPDAADRQEAATGSSSSPSSGTDRTEKAESSSATEGAQRPAKDKPDKQTTAGSKVICSLSPELQQQLASGVAGSDGSNFDRALNALKLDDATRENLRQELMIRPGVNPLQVEQLIAKCFRGKVNTLRSLGLRKLRTALGQALPEGVTGV